MADQPIAPARNLAGAVRPPGDKSISHRCAMLAALGEGTSQLTNYSTGADCRSTLGCMEALGAKVSLTPATQEQPETVTIAGVGLRGLRAPAGRLDAGNSGSTMRMLAGILAAQPFASEIAGDASLSRRPMRRIIEPLCAMGARIEAGEGERPPLRFTPAADGLRAIEYELPVASAQVKSAILLAGLYAQGRTRVIEPLPTRDHTELLLGRLGADVHRRLRPRVEVEVQGPVETLAALGALRIPGDPSSAAFFLCAAAAFPESSLLVADVSLNPTRSAVLDVLARLGVKLEFAALGDEGGELAGTVALAHSGRPMSGTVISGAEAVALIDEIPILAVLATATREGIEFRDVGELRVKESDRIATIAQNLRAMGAQCEESPNGLKVAGGQQLHGARIASRGDHRIAMAFSIAALLAEGESTIEGAECAAVSYPEFYETLERLVER